MPHACGGWTSRTGRRSRPAWRCPRTTASTLSSRSTVHPLVAALAARMEALLGSLEAGGDPARFFLGTYLRTTRAVGEALEGGRFEDPAWVADWDVDFAGLFLEALDDH